MQKYLYLLTPFFILAGISCQKEVTTSPEDVLLPKTLLFVDSNPQGSKIFIDNRYMGQRTPDTITWLEKGTHLVTLKQNLLKDSNIVVTIADDYSSIFFDYTTNPTMRGNLYCDSNPRGAEIYINDSNTALTTPKLIKGLFPAEYNIKYKLPGFWDTDSKAAVVSERTITIDTNLPDSTVWVNFTAANTGLPTDWYNDIDVQDGYIKWLASEGSGLIRYIGGKDFTVYNTDNSSIPSNKVKSVRVSVNGVWIGTDNGVALFNNGNFTVYNSSNSIVADSISCISPGSDGKVWAGSLNNGAYYFNGSSWTNYNKDNSLIRSNQITSIFVDHNGLVWIGTFGMGMLIFDGTNWVRVYNNLPSPRVDAIRVTESEIWVGTTSHTGYTYGSSGTPGGPPLPHPVYYSGGLGRLSGNIWTKFRDAGKSIVALALDSEGNVWFSDFLTGLAKKTPAAGYQRYFPYNQINGIVIDGAGHKWLSTLQRGIVKYKGN